MWRNLSQPQPRTYNFYQIALKEQYLVHTSIECSLVAFLFLYSDNVAAVKTAIVYITFIYIKITILRQLAVKDKCGRL